MYEDKKKQQKSRITVLVVLYAAYILAGIVYAGTSSHCRADLPIYIAGGIIATICVIAVGIYEAKLAKHLAQKG